MSLSACSWAYYDAQVRGTQLNPSMRLGILLLLGVFFPFYIIQTRGWKPGIKKIIKFLCLSFAAIIVLPLAIDVINSILYDLSTYL